MTNYSLLCEKEFQKLMEAVTFDKKFLFENEAQMKYYFRRIYVINLLKNRLELSEIFDSEFNEPFSLLLESTFSMFSGQCRASLLLLRSALESIFHFCTIKERERIKTIDSEAIFKEIDYRFIDTKQKFVEDITPYVSEVEYGEYFTTIERCTTYYKKLSSIVHSMNRKSPILISTFYVDLQEDTLIDKEDFFELYRETLNNIFVLLYFLLRNNLKEWDTYDLKDILKVIYKKEKQVQRYLGYIKFS